MTDDWADDWSGLWAKERFKEKSYMAFRSFLRNRANEVGSLVLDTIAKNLFQNHTDKVYQEAEKYRKYLHAEYKKAHKKGFTKDCGTIPKERGHWWWYSTNKDTDIYFMDDDDSDWNDLDFHPATVCFWMKGQPKLDPLGFIYSMARGTHGELHENLTLLDYQYFILACIHDCQRLAAGQTTIYFDQKAIVYSVFETCNFKNQICDNVYSAICSLSYRIHETVKTTIEIALQAVKTDCKKNEDRQQEPTEKVQKDNVWEDVSPQMKKAIQEYRQESKALKSEHKRLFIAKFCGRRKIDEDTFRSEKDKVEKRKERLKKSQRKT